MGCLRTWPDPSYFLGGGLQTWVQGKVGPNTNAIFWPGMLISAPFPCWFCSYLCHQPPHTRSEKPDLPCTSPSPCKHSPGHKALLSYSGCHSFRHCGSVGGLAFSPPCPSPAPPDSLLSPDAFPEPTAAKGRKSHQHLVRFY